LICGVGYGRIKFSQEGAFYIFPIETNTSIAIATTPSMLVGKYPQPRLCGHRGSAATSSTTAKISTSTPIFMSNPSEHC
jgi:hypothetical protein